MAKIRNYAETEGEPQSQPLESKAATNLEAAPRLDVPVGQGSESAVPRSMAPAPAPPSASTEEIPIIVMLDETKANRDEIVERLRAAGMEIPEMFDYRNLSSVGGSVPSRSILEELRKIPGVVSAEISRSVRLF